MPIEDDYYYPYEDEPTDDELLEDGFGELEWDELDDMDDDWESEELWNDDEDEEF